MLGRLRVGARWCPAAPLQNGSRETRLVTGLAASHAPPAPRCRPRDAPTRPRRPRGSSSRTPRRPRRAPRSCPSAAGPAPFPRQHVGLGGGVPAAARCPGRPSAPGPRPAGRRPSPPPKILILMDKWEDIGRDR